MNKYAAAVLPIVCTVLFFGGILGVVVGILWLHPGDHPAMCGDFPMTRDDFCVNGGGSYEAVERMQREEDERGRHTIGFSVAAILVSLPLAVWAGLAINKAERRI